MSERPVRFPLPLVRALIREARQPGHGKSQARFPAWDPALRLVGSEQVAGLVLLPRPGSLAPAPHRASIWCRTAADDALWVQEPWWFRPWAGTIGASSPARAVAAVRELSPAAGRVFYFATDLEAFHARCRSGPTMPRWASRLTLTVTAVRRQLLQQISREETIAEGLRRDGSRFWWDDEAKRAGTAPREVFADLWDDRYGKGSWNTNPEVIALTFTVSLKNW